MSEIQFINQSVRRGLRVAWLVGELGLAAADWMLHACAIRPKGNWRARWMQRAARRMLRIFGAQLRVEGAVPCHGFLVANHLGYLDILVLGACCPCVFVAKQEVRRWPVFGWFARLAGTVFVNRQSRPNSALAVAAMRQARAEDTLVVLFPEGTSSDGTTVLPFRTALLEPLVDEATCNIAHLSYALSEGRVADEVCYWRDMTLLPHLVNLLGKEKVTAQVRFSVVTTEGMDRKALGRLLHGRIAALAGRSDWRGNAPQVTGLSEVCHLPAAGL